MLRDFSELKKAVVVDVETTGFNPGKDRIVSVACALVDFSGLNLENCKHHDYGIKSLYTLINPERSIPKSSTKIHGITNDCVKNEKKFEEKAQEIRDFISNYPIIGHNIPFDENFLNYEFVRCGIKPLNLNKSYCTMKRFNPDRWRKLDYVADTLGIEGRKSEIHDALEDVLIASKIAAAFYLEDKFDISNSEKTSSSSSFMTFIIFVSIAFILVQCI